MNATQLCQSSLLDNIHAAFKQQNYENLQANGRERRANSQLFKDMAQSFMTYFEVCIRKELSPHPEAKSPLEVQLELMKEQQNNQAQAIELNSELVKREPPGEVP
jgi:hypothetical protein